MLDYRKIQPMILPNDEDPGKAHIPSECHHGCWTSSSKAMEHCFHIWNWDSKRFYVISRKFKWSVEIENLTKDRKITSIWMTIKSRNVNPSRTSMTDLHFISCNSKLKLACWLCKKASWDNYPERNFSFPNPGQWISLLLQISISIEVTNIL